VDFGRLIGPLEERQFRLLFIARGFSMFGDGLVPVALAFAVLSIERSASALGLVLAAGTVPRVLLLLVAGVWADRIPRDQVMVGADLLRFGSQGIAAVLLIGGHAQVWQLALLTLVHGVGAAFFLPASTGLIPQTVSPGRLQQANGLLSLTSSGFSILGPVIAGVLVATFGAGWALAADAATFLASAAFLLQLRVTSSVERIPASFLHELRAGWHEFTSRTWLWVDGLSPPSATSPCWLRSGRLAPSSPRNRSEERQRGRRSSPRSELARWSPARSLFASSRNGRC
jgi:MFS family permease